MQKMALIVDDSRVARMTLRKLLVAYQFEVIEHGSGEDALAYFQSGGAKPDIIFMDVMMDGMDGLEATRQIKADSSLNGIPVVICSGNDTEEDRQNALATGAIAVLSKPPVADALAAILAIFENETPAVIEPMPAVQNTVDEVALVANVVATIEHDLLPKVKQDVRDMAEDISRQIAADTVENMIAEQVKKLLDTMLPTLTEQLMDQAKQNAEQVAQQVAKQSARDAIAKTAEQAVQRAASEVDFSAQALQVFSSEGTTWLKHQGQQLQTQLSGQLDQLIASSISKHLETELAGLMTPIIYEQVNKQLTPRTSDDQSEQKLKQISNKATILSSIAIGISVVAIALNFIL